MRPALKFHRCLPPPGHQALPCMPHACPAPPCLLRAGERRCLACGRAFRGDVQRFLQHLKDAHGGRNAPGGGAAAAEGSGAGAASRAPGLRSVLQLGDMLLRAAPAPRAASRPAARQQLQPSQQAQRRLVPPKPSVSASASAPAAGAAAAAVGAVAPPPGTRQRSQRKRESRLKRAFRRSKAVQACSRWQGVLAGAAREGCLLSAARLTWPATVWRLQCPTAGADR